MSYISLTLNLMNYLLWCVNLKKYDNNWQAAALKKNCNYLRQILHLAHSELYVNQTKKSTYALLPMNSSANIPHNVN